MTLINRLLIDNLLRAVSPSQYLADQILIFQILNVQYLACEVLNFVGRTYFAGQIVNFQILNIQYLTNGKSVHRLTSGPQLRCQCFRRKSSIASAKALFFRFIDKIIKFVFVSTELGSYSNDAKFPWSGDI